MLRNAFDIGELFGVRIRMNWSLTIIFALIVFHLSVGVFPYWHPDWSAAMLLGVAVAAALVFFLSLLAHELAHALTARAYGIPVGSITLFLFGGVTDIQQEPDRPGLEALVAIVGPLTSAALGFIFLFAFSQFFPVTASQAEALGMSSQMGPVTTVLAWVGPINIILAVFNLLPALPLDGGRLLRAALWWGSGNLRQATRWAAATSRGISFLLIAIGVMMAFGLSVPFLGGGPVAGLWVAFIGWFLSRAAEGSYTRVVISETLEDVGVGRLTDRNIVTILPETKVSQLVEEYAANRPQKVFPVVDEQSQFRGVVFLEEVRQLAEKTWEHTTVTGAMTPADELYTPSTATPADEALSEMIRRGIDEVVVRDDGEIVGLLHQDNIFRWVRLHGERRKTGPPAPRTPTV